MKYGHASTGFAEFTHADTIARGAYRLVEAVGKVYRTWQIDRQTQRALAHLGRMNDRDLADIGLTRDDLTSGGLRTAAMKRNGG